LLLLHGDTVDLTNIREVVSEFAMALEDPVRLVEFDDLVRRAKVAETD